MKCRSSSDGHKRSHEALQVMCQQAVKAIREGEDVNSGFGPTRVSICCYPTFL